MVNGVTSCGLQTFDKCNFMYDSANEHVDGLVQELVSGELAIFVPLLVV